MITGAKTPEPNPPTSSLISIAKMASQIRMIIIVTKKTRILPPTVSSSPSRSSGFSVFSSFFPAFFCRLFNCFYLKLHFPSVNFLPLLFCHNLVHAFLVYCPVKITGFLSSPHDRCNLQAHQFLYSLHIAFPV